MPSWLPFALSVGIAVGTGLKTLLDWWLKRREQETSEEISLRRDLIGENRELRIEVRELRKERHALEEEHEKCPEQIRLLEARVRELEDENHRLRQVRLA